VSVRATATLTARKVFQRLPVAARDRLRRDNAVLSGITQVKRNQAMLARRIARLASTAAGPSPTEVTDPRFPHGVRSRICTEAQLHQAWFGAWCAAIHEEPRAHRKLWEHAYLAHVLDSLDMLRPGRRGLGFGVGRERLVALFAGRGCEIVATDLPPETEDARVWLDTEQYAGALMGLSYPALCEPEQFRDLVTWRSVDMRSPPCDLTGFDFCWSACSFEHLGSLAAGFEFVERSLATLRPGGIAVHTTEYNLGSDTATVARGHTVLYRRRDLEGLVTRLEAAGHQVARLELAPGSGVLDEYVDVPPYVDEPHLRLWYRKFVTTSVALVIRRRADS